MKKVYCRDCRHNDCGSNCRARIKVNDYTGQYKLKWTFESNKSGKCLWYQRKWWKFWEVKE